MNPEERLVSDVMGRLDWHEANPVVADFYRAKGNPPEFQTDDGSFAVLIALIDRLIRRHKWNRSSVYDAVDLGIDKADFQERLDRQSKQHGSNYSFEIQYSKVHREEGPSIWSADWAKERIMGEVSENAGFSLSEDVGYAAWDNKIVSHLAWCIANEGWAKPGEIVGISYLARDGYICLLKGGAVATVPDPDADIGDE